MCVRAAENPSQLTLWPFLWMTSISSSIASTLFSASKTSSSAFSAAFLLCLAIICIDSSLALAVSRLLFSNAGNKDTQFQYSNQKSNFALMPGYFSRAKYPLHTRNICEISWEKETIYNFLPLFMIAQTKICLFLIIIQGNKILAEQGTRYGGTFSS